MARAKSADALTGRLERVARAADKVHGRAIPPRPRPEPDPRSIRPWRLHEDPETRRRRLRAKTVNFACTLSARTVILFGACFYVWLEWDRYAEIDRRIVIGIFAMIADYGRVIMKALEPGTK